MKRVRLRFPLILAALFFILGVASVWISTQVISANFLRNRSTEYRDSAVRQMDALASELSGGEVLAASIDQPALRAKMNLLSRVFEADLYVVDQNFRVMEQTRFQKPGTDSADGMDSGTGTADRQLSAEAVRVENVSAADGAEGQRFMLMPGVMKCMSDKRTQMFRLSGNRYFIALPVLKKAEEAEGSADTAPAGDNLISARPILGVIVMVMRLERLDMILKNYENSTEIINLLALLIMAILSPLLALLLKRPFDRLYQYVSRIAKGDYSPNAYGVTYVETEAISSVLEATVRKLAELDKSRGEFVQNVSHELKTPLTSVKILADSLKGMKEVPNEMYREFIEDISTEVDRENKIIDDLLTLVRMDKAANSQLNIEKQNMNQLLEGIMKRMAPIAKNNDISLAFESRREVTAEVDGVKLTLAIMNIVENAIKYNYAGGWVHVGLDANYRNCIITISDSGSGIPTESLDQIFERFYRVDKARSREIGGTGLGLSITKNIIDLHRGEILVESSFEEEVARMKGVNREVLENADVSVTGTVFTVLLPLKHIRQDAERNKKRAAGRMSKYAHLTLMSLLTIALLQGCAWGGREVCTDNPYENVVELPDSSEPDSYILYRPSVLLTELVPYAVTLDTGRLPESLSQSFAREADDESVEVLPGDIQLQRVEQSGDLLTISLSKAYLDLKANREILTRAALVRTLLQLPGVRRVEILVEGQPMAGADGTVYQSYTEDSFIFK